MAEKLNIHKKEYREFLNADETADWGKKYYGEWGKRYKEIMKEAKPVLSCECFASVIENYCGHSSKSLNLYLRENYQDKKTNSEHEADKVKEMCRISEMADILSIVLCYAPRIPHNLVVYRMVDDNFVRMLSEDSRKSGGYTEEPGFLSTSLLKKIAEDKEYEHRGNLLKIYVPRGSVGAYINEIMARDEEEILFLPNAGLTMLDYPAKDKETGKKVFEIALTENGRRNKI